MPKGNLYLGNRPAVRWSGYFKDKRGNRKEERIFFLNILPDMSRTSHIHLLLHSLSVFLPLASHKLWSKNRSHYTPLYSLFLTCTHTLIQQRTESVGGVVGRDQRWWNGLCVGRLDKKTLMLLSWWFESHSHTLTATRGNTHPSPMADRRSRWHIRGGDQVFGFCGDGSISELKAT